MAANSANVAAIVSPYQGNIYDVQTKQALAQALMKQGMTGGVENYRPAGGGYQYVPTYGVGAGLTQLASMLGGALLQKQASQELSDISARQYAALTGEGLPQAQSGPTAEQLATAMGGGGGPTNANAQQLAQAMTPQASVQRQPAPLAPGGTLNPSGAPTALAYQAYQLDPAAYTAKAMEYYKPADIVAKLRAAGIDPSSTIGQQLVQQNIAKENYIPQQAFSPGQTVFNPATGKSEVIPNVGEGMEVVTRSDGTKMVVGIPNYNETLQGRERAKALGTAGAEPMVGVDAAGNPVFSNKAAVATGQASGPQNINAGRFNGYQAPGSGFRPALSAGEQTAAGKMGEQNQQRYTDIQNQAAGAADRQNMLSAIEAYAAGPTKFGPGWEKRIENIAALNSKLPSDFQFSSDAAANAQAVQKYASTLIQSAQRSGGSGMTDKQMEMIQHGTPGTEMYNKTILEIAPKLRALEAANQAKANAADAFVAANNNSTAKLNQFESMWRQNYDPRIYQLAVLTPKERDAKLTEWGNPKDLINKLIIAKNNGWIK